MALCRQYGADRSLPGAQCRAGTALWGGLRLAVLYVLFRSLLAVAVLGIADIDTFFVSRCRGDWVYQHLRERRRPVGTTDCRAHEKPGDRRFRLLVIFGLLLCSRWRHHSLPETETENRIRLVEGLHMDA